MGRIFPRAHLPFEILSLVRGLLGLRPLFKTYCFLIVEFCVFFFIFLHKSPLSDVSFANVFPPISGLSFHSL